MFFQIRRFSFSNQSTSFQNFRHSENTLVAGSGTDDLIFLLVHPVYLPAHSMRFDQFSFLAFPTFTVLGGVCLIQVVSCAVVAGSVTD
jgi:hypothetical protein